MQRRTLLAGVSALLTAGCLSLEPGPRLGRIVMGNFTTSSVSVTVAVLEYGSAVYEGTHDIEANDPDSIVVPTATIRHELPGEPGEYVIEYGLESEEPKSFDFSEHVGTDCGQIHVDVREDDRVDLFVSNSCDTLD